MSYTLQAIVGVLPDLREALPDNVVVALEQGVGLIPLTDSLREAHDIPFLAFGEELVTDGLSSLVRPLKKGAYLEAEYFGGQGNQASVIWEDGSLVFGPIRAADAINQALRLFGVEKKDCLDEFEALGLGRHRSTEKRK
jgi:hypothetical protein